MSQPRRHSSPSLPPEETPALRKLGNQPLALAVRALCLLDARFATGCTVQAALQQLLARIPQGDHSRQDKALTSELAYGTLRQERRLGVVLRRLVKNPHRLPLPLRRLLSVAAYALLFLERMPDHAVLHSAVDMSRRLYGSGLAGLVNGTLRSLQRLGDAPLAPDFYDGPAVDDFFARTPGQGGDGRLAPDLRRLSRYYALPPHVALWLDDEAEHDPLRREALFRRSASRPWSAWRVNAAHPDATALRAALLDSVVSGASAADTPARSSAKPAAEQVAAVGRWGVAFAPGCQPDMLQGRPLAQWQDEGALTPQAAGSQLIMEELGLFAWCHEGRDIWDACSGQGGKAAQLLEAGGRVRLCTDTSLSRLRQARQNLGRAGGGLPLLALADGRHPCVPPVSWQGGIIADVPCSGLGVLARRPDIRRRSAAEQKALFPLQRQIAAALLRCLAPGGELVYMTCTLHREENEIALEALLRQADFPVEIMSSWKTPWEHPWCEGMFGARLRRLA